MRVKSSGHQACKSEPVIAHPTLRWLYLSMSAAWIMSASADKGNALCPNEV